MKLIDISPLITPNIAVFPGDTPFSQEFLLSFKEQSHIDLSTIRSTVHLGAHTDAPSHYHCDGESIEKRDLNFYFGPCQVLEVQAEASERLNIQHLKGKKITQPRVLFKTSSFPDPNKWNDNFNSLSPELIDFLKEKGVILVGIDTPSIDPANDQKLLSHNAIFKNNMAILEGVILQKINEGTYTLIALPLNIKDSDASPVRAVLIKED